MYYIEIGLFETSHMWITPTILNSLQFFFLFYQHFLFWWTCKKLLYLYSRPHLSHTYNLSGEFKEFEYFSRKDLSLSANLFIWVLKSSGSSGGGVWILVSTTGTSEKENFGITIREKRIQQTALLWSKTTLIVSFALG